ncbi:MAG TPA: hypothetical protein VKR31_10305 [Rhizomicrobium sp.]|nr:hypothetical protein [Rhizomicrobium sp.]
MKKCLVLAALVTAAAAAAVAQPSETPNGCLHQPLAACVVWLGQNMTITSDFDAQRALAAQPEVDVNGKPLPGPTTAMVMGDIDGLGIVPSLPGHFMVSMDLAPDKTVKGIEVGLPNDPAHAQTSAEYARTGLWQALNMMIGTPCVDEATAYRFFENSVKPTISQPKKDTSLDSIHASESFFRHSAQVQLCGHKFSYSYLIGTDTNDISLENPHGVSSLIGVHFE